MQNQTDKAIEQYQKVIAKKPDAAIYTLLGMLKIRVRITMNLKNIIVKP